MQGARTFVNLYEPTTAIVLIKGVTFNLETNHFPCRLQSKMKIIPHFPHSTWLIQYLIYLFTFSLPHKRRTNGYSRQNGGHTNMKLKLIWCLLSDGRGSKECSECLCAARTPGLLRSPSASHWQERDLMHLPLIPSNPSVQKMQKTD